MREKGVRAIVVMSNQVFLKNVRQALRRPCSEIEVTSLTGRIALLAPRLQNLLGPETLVVSRVNSEQTSAAEAGRLPGCLDSKQSINSARPAGICEFTSSTGRCGS